MNSTVSRKNNSSKEVQIKRPLTPEEVEVMRTVAQILTDDPDAHIEIKKDPKCGYGVYAFKKTKKR